ncbi:hypothetical protein LV457_17115 [Mycobacterium sp. MYCO198283]|uniref:hypothetical protein n=1 Tax=Mycobacterium sp. MYCO198283 TaxID=2883505 RepID=UPI001E38C8B0|nr:hypothetical protein [Mycobacterium sp. MYCO198283]MCG5433994.1 hypothetical protein [Mycobacterium sp. MYCO198283]
MRRRALRRKLLLYSAPIVLLLVVVAVKLLSVSVVGRSALSDVAAGNVAALREDVDVLSTLDIVEPAKTAFVAGNLAVLENRLADADAAFGEALAGTDPAASCPVRINLELVREVQGDVAGWERDVEAARERYTSALTIVGEAPAGCFAGNTDPDPQRRAVRADAAERLRTKLAGLANPLPPPPPPPAAVPAAPPPPPPPGAEAESQPPSPAELGPGDPFERLRKILRDGAAARAG